MSIEVSLPEEGKTEEKDSTNREVKSMKLLSQITSGRSPSPRRVMLYGTQGIGKSTFAANAPKPVFIQTEDGLGEIDCDKFPLADFGKKGIVNDDGYSGKDLNRPGIRAILESVNRKREFDGLSATMGVCDIKVGQAKYRSIDKSSRHSPALWVVTHGS